MGHARVWAHVQQMQPEDISSKSDQLEDVLPILGELAGNPKVTSKMVIKASAQASADGKISPDEAVKFISQMPPDPDKLQPWLRTLYAANLAAQVHMKAAMIKASQPLPQVPQPPRSAPPRPNALTPPPPTSMTPGVSPIA